MSVSECKTQRSEVTTFGFSDRSGIVFALDRWKQTFERVLVEITLRVCQVDSCFSTGGVNLFFSVSLHGRSVWDLT